MKEIWVTAALAAAICTVCGMVVIANHETEPTGTQFIEHVGAGTSNVTAPVPMFSQVASGSALISPFGRGAPPSIKTMDQRLAERKLRMQALGLSTSDEYHVMSFNQLRQRAAKQDVPAMLQLAMRYGDETMELELEVDYDRSVDSRQEQKKYLAAAVDAGHIHSAAVLASLYLQERATADAYAWHLLAARLGDSDGAQLAQDAFSALSYADRQAAEARAQALFMQVNQRFVKPSAKL